MTGDDPVPCIDRRGLPNLNVFGLGLGNAELGFQRRWVAHPCQVGARGHALALFQGYLLEHARNARTDVEVLHLVEPQLPECLQAVDLCVFGCELDVYRFAGDLQPFVFELVPGGQLARPRL